MSRGYSKSLYGYGYTDAELYGRCAEASARLAKAKQCHPQCRDGYCHVAYMQAPILNKAP